MRQPHVERVTWLLDRVPAAEKLQINCALC